MLDKKEGSLTASYPAIGKTLPAVIETEEKNERMLCERTSC